MGEDPKKVIVHPGHGQEDEEEQFHLPQPIPEQQQAEVVDEEVIDNLNLNMEVQIPALQAPMDNFLHLEIPEDDLMDLDTGNQQSWIRESKERMRV